MGLGDPRKLNVKGEVSVEFKAKFRGSVLKSGFEGHVRNVAKPVHRALHHLTGTHLTQRT